MTTMESVQAVFQFMGGLGMFLYGMHIMADGLQKSAGSRVKKLLGFLTNNRIMAIMVGALITAIIQSSGATTVMVVGFVNAGILSLTQAVGVIMGANIGTTITAWIVSLSQLGDAFEVMQPAFYAYWNWRPDAAVLQKSEEGDGGRDLDRHRAALYRA